MLIRVATFPKVVVKMFWIPLLTNTLTIFKCFWSMFSCILSILLVAKYWSRKPIKSQHRRLFECNIVLRKIDALGRFIPTLRIVYFGTQFAVFEWAIKMLVSDGRPLVYQHLPTLCRISAVTVSVMSFCNGNLRRIFIANREPSLFSMVSRHFLKPITSLLVF